MAGRMYEDALAYDGGRRVSAWVPARAAELVVFAGDGQLITAWGERLEAAGGPATAIVGAHRADDEAQRLQEYCPTLDGERFAAHERFFLGELRSWGEARVGRRLPGRRTAVCGVSAGGELALALGLRHAEIFGAVFCASPGGGFRPPSPLMRRLPRTYLVAGTDEPFFLENAQRWARALEEAGAEVVMTERSGSHGGAFWQTEFALMAAWAVDDSAGA